GPAKASTAESPPSWGGQRVVSDGEAADGRYPECAAEELRGDEVAGERGVHDHNKQPRRSEGSDLPPQRPDDNLHRAVSRAGDQGAASQVADQRHHGRETGGQRDVQTSQSDPDDREGRATQVATGQQRNSKTPEEH